MRKDLKCINLPRVAAQNISNVLNPYSCAWISFEDPDDPKSVVDNVVLNSCPNLKLAIYDLQEETTCVLSGQKFYPPSKEDARRIVDFVKENTGRNFIVNCAAGVSRSGAVCQFLQDCLGYKWLEEGKSNAAPNELLVKLLKEEFCNQDESLSVQRSKINL